MPETAPRIKLGPVLGLLPDIRSPYDLVAFAACDDKYAQEHALALVASIRANSPQTKIHLHIVNPTDATLTRMAVEVARHRNTVDGYRFTFTHEVTNGLGDKTLSWYACSRFVRGAQIANTVAGNYLFLDADCLVRKPIERITKDVGLFLRPDHPDHMAVAAGAVYIANTVKAREFLSGVAQTILENFGSADWFLDQMVLNGAHKIYSRQWRGPTFHQIGPNFLDWEFEEDTVIWTGKGPRKTENETYVAALEEWQARATDWHKDFWDGKGKRVCVFHPEPRVPYKDVGQAVPLGQISDELAAIRGPWLDFTYAVANALSQRGAQVKRLTLPNWMITPAFVDAFRADLAIVPHRQRKRFQAATDCLFYMQMHDRSVFTLDPNGWGAEASGYPFKDWEKKKAPPGGFDRLYRRLVQGRASKFDQPGDRILKLSSDFETFDTEAHAGYFDLPDEYIFFPCQIPHDENVVQQCDWPERDVVEALARWATERGVHVVFKEHPANKASMEPLKQAAPEGGFIHWVDANVHDLIAGAKAVYTLNSGVGFEALLHGKRAVTFGRADYDALAWHMPGLSQDALDGAWEWAQIPAEPSDWPRQFIDWYVGAHAYDMTAPEFSERLHKTAGALT